MAPSPQPEEQPVIFDFDGTRVRCVSLCRARAGTTIGRQADFDTCPPHGGLSGTREISTLVTFHDPLAERRYDIADGPLSGFRWSRDEAQSDLHRRPHR